MCHCVHGSNLLVAQLRDKRSYYRARFVPIVFPYLRAHANFIRETDSFPSARDCTRAVNFYAHVQRIARLSIITKMPAHFIATATLDSRGIFGSANNATCILHRGFCTSVLYSAASCRVKKAILRVGVYCTVIGYS